MKLEISQMDSPLGTIALAADGSTLCVLGFAMERAELERDVRRRLPGATLVERAAPPAEIGERLAAYFAGTLDALDGIAVRGAGTEFQRRVWAELRRIPAGQTISYRTLAERIGRPSAMRAVGAANGANPIALVVPCHRVVAADGTLGGYAAGLERKRWLLEHEGAALRPRAGTQHGPAEPFPPVPVASGRPAGSGAVQQALF